VSPLDYYHGFVLMQLNPLIPSFSPNGGEGEPHIELGGQVEIMVESAAKPITYQSTD
jgi:hypothetical protein